MEIDQNLIKEFHTAFGAPVADSPTLIPADRAKLRYRLMAEELDEYLVAVTEQDIVEIADALGDLLYVVLGSAIEHGIDLEPVIKEIHASNMSKLVSCEECNAVGSVELMNPFGNTSTWTCSNCKGYGGVALLRADGKILKGPDFRLPDLKRVIAELDK